MVTSILDLFTHNANFFYLLTTKFSIQSILHLKPVPSCSPVDESLAGERSNAKLRGDLLLYDRRVKHIWIIARDMLKLLVRNVKKDRTSCTCI